MIQVVKQTREEKVAMYMKLTKRELVELLLNNIELLQHRPSVVEYPKSKPIQPFPEWDYTWDAPCRDKWLAASSTRFRCKLSPTKHSGCMSSTQVRRRTPGTGGR